MRDASAMICRYALAWLRPPDRVRPLPRAVRRGGSHSRAVFFPRVIVESAPGRIGAQIGVMERTDDGRNVDARNCEIEADGFQVKLLDGLAGPGVELGQQRTQRMQTLAGALSLAESLTSRPRFAFRPRSIASCSVRASGAGDAAPMGTLPWNWLV